MNLKEGFVTIQGSWLEIDKRPDKIFRQGSTGTRGVSEQKQVTGALAF